MSRPAQRRARLVPPRERRIVIRLDAAEHALVKNAAGESGLTTAGFTAEAALAAARGHTDGPGQDREALHKLLAARSQLRRYGNNVNQAVRVFHSIGQPPPWLLDAIRITDQTVRRIDQAADRLAHPTGAPAPRRRAAGVPNTGRPSSVPPDTDSGGIR